MINHPEDFLSWDVTIECDRIPMFFVHVVARLHRLVLLTPFNRLLRVALEIDRERSLGNIREEKNLPVDSEYQHPLVKRKILGDLARLLETILADGFEIHDRIRELDAKM